MHSHADHNALKTKTQCTHNVLLLPMLLLIHHDQSFSDEGLRILHLLLGAPDRVPPLTEIWEINVIMHSYIGQKLSHNVLVWMHWITMYTYAYKIFIMRTSVCKTSHNVLICMESIIMHPYINFGWSWMENGSPCYCIILPFCQAPKVGKNILAPKLKLQTKIHCFNRSSH